MDKRAKKPIQLHLELRLDYLKNINTCCEEPAFYESMSQALMGEYKHLSNSYPMWDEISRMR
jgi:hypothetical protein